MRYLCKIGSTEHRVELNPEGLAYRQAGRDLSGKLDGKIFQAFPLTSTRSGLLSVIIDNRPYNLNIDTEEDYYLITIEGELIRIGIINEIIKDSIPGDRFRSRKGGEGILKTRMAGRVTSIDVRSGERVESGRRLLVIEAMKMENEIKARRGCLIKEVFVNEGDLVRPGDRLMEIE